MDKVKKARCLQLGINTAKSTSTYRPPVAPAIPSAPDTASVSRSCPGGPFSTTSNSLLSAFPRTRHAVPCCWLAGGARPPRSPNLGSHHHGYSQPGPDHHTAQAFQAPPRPSGGIGGFLAASPPSRSRASCLPLGRGRLVLTARATAGGYQLRHTSCPSRILLSAVAFNNST